MGFPSAVLAARSAVGAIATDGQVRNAAFRVSPKGVFLTTAHTFDAHRGLLEVVANDNIMVPAELRFLEPLMDAALVEADAPGAYLKFGTAEIGEPCWLVGMQSTLRNAITPGTVVAGPNYNAIGNPFEFVQVVPIASPVQQGSSGAPWVNGRGEVVGVQSSRFEGGGIASAAIIDPQLLRGSGVSTIGADLNDWCNQMDPLRDGQSRVVPGVRIYPHRPPQASPARDAGLADEDLVISCNGVNVRYQDELLDEVRTKPVGSKLSLIFRRKEQTFKATVTTITLRQGTAVGLIPL